MSAHDVKHPYHLVEPSPWPAVGATAALATALGAVLYMHEKPFGTVLVIVGFLLILGTMFFWWRDVIREAEYQGHHSLVVQIGMRYGMMLFISSEVMFFVAFFWAFFDASLFPDGGVWPPEGIETFDPWDIPLINTLILLTSSCTVTWAHHGIIAGDRNALTKGLALTVFLGVIFTGFQIYEYDHATFAFTDGIYASTFYLATGFHGFHVFVGTMFLLVCYFRARAGHFTPEHHFGLEAAAWYWHFVDVVWIFLFASIYIWGA